MVKFTFLSTLVFVFLSGVISHFNKCYSPPLTSVKKINTANPILLGKDNQLDHSTKLDYRLRTVVIDPGHGGNDRGCKGTHSKEKHISLKIAKKLGNYIKNKFPNVTVIYTRDKDVFVPLHRRAEIANQNKADLFISIHCNAISKQKHLAIGTETYVMGLHNAEENLAVAKRENAAILLEKNYEKNYGGFDPESPEGHIILTMFQNAFLEQSIAFAEKVEMNFNHIAHRKSRGVKQAGFLVLRETTMPSVLIETGYLSNKKEEQFMNSSKGQDDLAFAIFQAFKSYKKDLELENSTTPSLLPANNPTPKKDFPKKKKPINVGSNNPMPTPEKAKKSENNSFQSAPKRTKHRRKRYHVQLAAATKRINTQSKKWGKVKFPIEIKRENGFFKYLAGNFKTKKEANAACQQLKKLGFKDAFVN